MNKLYIKTSHRIVEAFSYVLLAVSLVIIIACMATADGAVPIHYDIYGNPDDHGDVGTYIICPILFFIMNGFGSVMMRFISIEEWNMPCKVNPGAKQYVFSDAMWLFVLSNLFFSIMSFMISLKVVLPVTVGNWLIFGSMGLLTVGIVIIIIKICYDNKKYA